MLKNVLTTIVKEAKIEQVKYKYIKICIFNYFKV